MGSFQTRTIHGRSGSDVSSIVGSSTSTGASMGAVMVMSAPVPCPAEGGGARFALSPTSRRLLRLAPAQRASCSYQLPQGMRGCRRGLSFVLVQAEHEDERGHPDGHRAEDVDADE